VYAVQTLYSKCNPYGHKSGSQYSVIFIRNLVCGRELFYSLYLPSNGDILSPVNTFQITPRTF
jgi:hypothetical protein